MENFIALIRVAGRDSCPIQFLWCRKVTWSPTQTASILEYPDGSNIYYDFDTKRQVTIPKHWEEFSFAPQGDRITSKSIGFSPENRWIVSANPDGTDVKIVAYSWQQG